MKKLASILVVGLMAFMFASCSPHVRQVTVQPLRQSRTHPKQ